MLPAQLSLGPKAYSLLFYFSCFFHILLFGLYQFHLPRLYSRFWPKKEHTVVCDLPSTQMHNYLKFHKLSKPFRTFPTSIYHEHIPKIVMKLLLYFFRKKAMKDELIASERNQTREVVQPPSRKKPIGCKWVFTIKYLYLKKTIKYLSDGRIERYNTRPVAESYTLTYGIDYGETVAPVAKMNIIRILISIAPHFSQPLFQYEAESLFFPRGDKRDKIQSLMIAQ